MASYPRVTTILEAAGLSADYSGISPDTLRVAGERGTGLHLAAEGDHYGFGVKLAPEWAPRFDAYLKFRAEIPHEPVLSEFEVVSAHWRYQGHPDRLAWLDTDRTLFDWKFVDTLDPEPVGRQLAAYRLAWHEMHPGKPIHRVIAVQFRSDGTYRVREFAAADLGVAEQEFQAACIVWHARHKKGDG